MIEYNESEFLIETEVPEDELIISRTDLQGVRHPDMPSAAFKELWETVESGKQWIGIVKNMRKDRGYYWVKAIVSGVYKNGELVEYKSLRTPISYETKLKYQKLYDKMRAENNERVRKVIYK